MALSVRGAEHPQYLYSAALSVCSDGSVLKILCYFKD